MEMLKLNSLGLGKLQDVKTVLTMAKRAGLNLKQLITEINYHVDKTTLDMDKERQLRDKIEEADFKRASNFPNLRCPVCGQYSKLLPVNIDAKTMVEGGYNSCGVCYNPKCMNTDYFTETVREKIEQVGVISE